MDVVWIGFAGLSALAMMSLLSHERKRRMDARGIDSTPVIAGDPRPAAATPGSRPTRPAG